MSYVETPQVSQKSTDTQYDVTSTIQDLDVTVPIELIAFGVVISTEFVVSTAPIWEIATSANDRSTFTAQASVTIPTGAAVGNVYVNRIAGGVRVNPGQIARMRVKTQGVGSAGQARPFFVYKYAPQADQSNLTVVTV